MKKTDVDYTDRAVDRAGRKSNLSMFMVMLGFTFFSASMWVGQQLAAGLNWWGFIWALLLGGLILAAYTGSLGFIGAESGLSLDMLARRSFGTKGSYLPSAMISFTQIGWFGVGLAMFAIPVAKELMGLDVTPDHMPWQGYLLVAIAGVLMTASAYFGIKSLTIISYIAVPAVAILGTLAMILAVRRGDVGLVEQFTSSMFAITLTLSFLSWTNLARVVRGKILSLREEDYAVAARLLGASHTRILFRHLLPGFTSHIIVSLSLTVPGMILGETSLSFLGLGLRPPVVSWGVMLQDCMNVKAVIDYPWLLAPVVMLVFAVLCFNFLGDGLRDAADPYAVK